VTSLLPELFKSLYKDLNPEQEEAMQILHSNQNVFITGSAGTGKSYLINQYLKGSDRESIPVLASTGAAAVLIGGRTFHSFFALGIMEGGAEKTIDKALKDRRAVSRIRKARVIVIDEISMIPGEVLSVAERIASLARDSPEVWGGLKIIAVGDFAQLPPINRFSRTKDWAFLSSTWQRSQFKSIYLKQMMRVQEDQEFCQILEDVREGIFSDRLRELLEWRTLLVDESYEATVLYAKKVDVARVNNQKLAELGGEEHIFNTQYSGSSRFLKAIKNNAPVEESIHLKEGAFVMLRQNDPMQRWVNGSLGHILNIEENKLKIKLLNGRVIEISQASFSMLDAEGKEVAAARNFPISLAWAVTIHKSQGATLDKAIVSLRELWEPGQAYVAISRVRSSEALMISGWDERSIIADPQVKDFHLSLKEQI